jgi:hypothetical protein
MPVKAKAWAYPYDPNFSNIIKRRQQDAFVLEFVSEFFEELGWVYYPRGWSSSASYQTRWYFKKNVSNIRTLECVAHFLDGAPRTKIDCTIRLISSYRDRLHHERTHASWIEGFSVHEEVLVYDSGWGCWDLKRAIREKKLELADPTFAEQIAAYLEKVEKCWLGILKDVEDT